MRGYEREYGGEGEGESGGVETISDPVLPDAHLYMQPGSQVYTQSQMENFC